VGVVFGVVACGAGAVPVTVVVVVTVVGSPATVVVWVVVVPDTPTAPAAAPMIKPIRAPANHFQFRRHHALFSGELPGVPGGTGGPGGCGGSGPTDTRQHSRADHVTVGACPHHWNASPNPGVPEGLEAPHAPQLVSSRVKTFRESDATGAVSRPRTSRFGCTLRPTSADNWRLIKPSRPVT
jgi:hypothetical protein